MNIIASPIFAIGTSKLPSGIEYTDIGKRIDSYFTENEKTSASMSIAVFTGKDILYEGYYGYADKKIVLL